MDGERNGEQTGERNREREHEQQLEWIDLAVDGALDAGRRSELDEHLSSCGDCRRELARAEAVAGRLAEARIEVRAGFAHGVRLALAALEPAPWEARAPRSWQLPLALLLLLGGASALLFGSGAVVFAPAGGAGGALFALADLFRAALVAGSGLAAASWRAVGAATGTWLGGSAANWIAAVVLVIGVNYLLVRLLRLRRPALESATLPSSGDSTRRP